jgi:hypothetical protein
MVVFRVIERAPHEQHVLCNHVADQNMGIMTKRLGDRSKFPTKQYKHRWVYYKPKPAILYTQQQLRTRMSSLEQGERGNDCDCRTYTQKERGVCLH